MGKPLSYLCRLPNLIFVNFQLWILDLRTIHVTSLLYRNSTSFIIFWLPFPDSHILTILRFLYGSVTVSFRFIHSHSASVIFQVLFLDFHLITSTSHFRSHIYVFRLPFPYSYFAIFTFRRRCFIFNFWNLTTSLLWPVSDSTFVLRLSLPGAYFLAFILQAPFFDFHFPTGWFRLPINVFWLLFIVFLSIILLFRLK